MGENGGLGMLGRGVELLGRGIEGLGVVEENLQYCAIIFSFKRLCIYGR